VHLLGLLLPPRRGSLPCGLGPSYFVERLPHLATTLAEADSGSILAVNDSSTSQSRYGDLDAVNKIYRASTQSRGLS
jgi:hypothetical protein